MTMWLKQSTAITVALGPFLDETDGKTVESGLTISQADVRLSKNGGAFAQVNESTSASHMENGYYSKDLNTTDTGTLGRLKIHVHESGALPVWLDYMIVPANVWDSLYGADLLQVDAVQAAGTAWNSGAIGAATLASDTIAAAKIADGALTAAKFASGAFDAVWTVAARTLTSFGTLASDVWAVATRVLTAGTNIVLAKGVGVTGFNDLSAAQVNSEVDTALADYDAPTNAEMVARTLAAADYATATAVDALPTNAELATALGTADDAVLAAIAALNDVSPADLAAALATYDGPTKAELDSAVALLATAANLATLQTTANAVETDTQDIQSRLPAALVGGRMVANVRAVNDVALTGTGVLGDEWGPA